MDKKRKNPLLDDSGKPSKVKILSINEINEGKGLTRSLDALVQGETSDGERERSVTPLVPIRSFRDPAPTSDSDGATERLRDQEKGDDVATKPKKSQGSLWDAIMKQVKLISEEEAKKVGESQVPKESQVHKYLGSCLRTATKRNLLEIIKKLIEEEKVDPDIGDSNGTTPIMIAAANGHLQVFEFFMHVSNLCLVDKNQLTVLHHAAKSNEERVIKLLLSDSRRRVDINAKNKKGMTPLMIACNEGCDKVVGELLLNELLDVNLADNTEDTALLNACSKGHEAIVSMLLDARDIEVNKANSNKDTALMIASNESHPGVVRLLLSKDDIDVNAQNADLYTALMCGCDKGNEEIVRSLLDQEDIDVNLQDSNRETALIWACDKEKSEVISMLLQREELSRSDSNVESLVHVVMKQATEKRDMDSVIKTAVSKGMPDIAVWFLKADNLDLKPEFYQDILLQAVQNCQVSLIEYLLDRNLADVNHTDVNTNTLLIHAVNNSNDKSYDVAKLLIKKNVNVNAQGKERNTALMIACDNSRLDLVNLLLLNSDVDVNLEGEDLYTPLIIASGKDDLDVVRTLLKHDGIEVNKRGHEGKSALVLAAEKGYHQIVRILVERSETDVNSQDGGGYTALMWGADMGFPEVVQELMKSERLEPNIRDADGHTALTWAADKGFVEIVRILLTREDLVINDKDDEGYNPFLCAGRGGYLDVVKLLAEDDRTDVNVQDKEGDSALHNAVVKGFEDIVKYLVTHPRVNKDLKNNKAKTAEVLAKQKKKANKIYALFK